MSVAKRSFQHIYQKYGAGPRCTHGRCDHLQRPICSARGWQGARALTGCGGSTRQGSGLVVRQCGETGSVEIDGFRSGASDLCVPWRTSQKRFSVSRDICHSTSAGSSLRAARSRSVRWCRSKTQPCPIELSSNGTRTTWMPWACSRWIASVSAC